jgi:hypothetical protein
MGRRFAGFAVLAEAAELDMDADKGSAPRRLVARRLAARRQARRRPARADNTKSLQAGIGASPN